MPTPIDPKRLPTLRAALKRFKPGQMASQQDLAKIYGVTNARFTTLAHQRFEDFPPFERHGDKTHWYEAQPAIRSMISYLEGSGRKKAVQARQAAKIMGAAVKEASDAPRPAADDPVMGPSEIDRLASAQTRLFRLAQEKRQYVPASAAQHMIRALFTTVQRSVASLPSEIDPNGELPPLHRARLEQATRDVMVNLHKTVATQLEDGASAL